MQCSSWHSLACGHQPEVAPAGYTGIAGTHGVRSTRAPGLVVGARPMASGAVGSLSISLGAWGECAPVFAASRSSHWLH
eukprot:scaffold268350_cov36-Tisochrysis_lutea.AAC.1